MATEYKQLKFRRGTAVEWQANPVLAEGEPGVDLTARRMKVGDGQNAWSALPWVTMDAAEVARLEAAATALDAAADPYDAATATVLALPDGVARQELQRTIDAGVQEARTRPLPQRDSRAVVVLSFDDGPSQDLTTVKPLLEAQGVRGSFGIITSQVGQSGRMTWAQIHTLEDAGHEILCHSATHPDLDDSASAATLDAEIVGAHQAMIAQGLDVTGFIWPNQKSSASSRRVARKVFSYGLGGQSGGYAEPIATYAIGRTTIDTNASLATLQARVDTAITNNELLVFIVHAGLDFGAAVQQKLNDVIDYVQSKNVPIVTARQALSMIGNLADAGDVTEGNAFYVVGRSGAIYANGTGVLLPTNAITAATGAATFPRGQITYCSVNSAGNTDWPATGVSGNIITDRTDGSAFGFMRQTFIASDGRTWIRRPTSGSAWGSWVSTVSTTTTASTNSVTAASAPSAFASGKVTYTTVNSAGNTDWPVTGATGNILVDRSEGSSYAYCYQTFITGRRQFIRRAVDASTWGDWMTVTATRLEVINTITAAVTPYGFPVGEISRAVVSSAGNTDWPVTGVVGHIETERLASGSGLYVLQTFRCDAGIYQRRGAAAGSSWQAWRSVALA